ncbi:MAG: hypothetical protein FWG90_03260 [Oscillospiraceae bacterium]|nr:hypothetical protein [Oscillospiraceae bacterium]
MNVHISIVILWLIYSIMTISATKNVINRDYQKERFEDTIENTQKLPSQMATGVWNGALSAAILLAIILIFYLIATAVIINNTIFTLIVAILIADCIAGVAVSVYMVNGIMDGNEKVMDFIHKLQKLKLAIYFLNLFHTIYFGIYIFTGISLFA